MTKQLNFITLIILMILSACANRKAMQSSIERDGSSFEKAIIITETSSRPGIAAEYSWIRKNHPGYAPQGQSLVHKDKRSFDIIKTANAKGEEKLFYFDITNFFGKF
ncbi:hypothetical protein EOD41_19400 [Mucilaginibacter limnophilus]|uniref:Lipoprotein n=1 Tax=Mucilaginibacter limnophilus TaxID=1932778 RepID=A0A3S2Y0N0_9SPHI|nr:hypothetical protein [Mucilaginibacter limnophilus]RVT97176.1 hypothetical protein EOD41_19400 [Mucilaginibacter limnophilus]